MIEPIKTHFACNVTYKNRQRSTLTPSCSNRVMVFVLSCGAQNQVQSSSSMEILGKIEMGSSVRLWSTPAYLMRRVDTPVKLRRVRVRASLVDAYGSSSSNFSKRMEQAWLISQQPEPIACTSCEEKGCVECKWCAGTGFFILGDNMLCQVPSRNTTCVICTGKGSTCCPDCKGTGFRAKWLEEPNTSK